MNQAAKEPSKTYVIFHGIPYIGMLYEQQIDHETNHVVYIGNEESLKDIPYSLKHQKLVLYGLTKTEQEAIELLKKNKIQPDVVLAFSEFDIIPAAKLREEFNVANGPTLEEAIAVRNKDIMKQRVSSAGILAPRYVLLKDFKKNLNLFKSKVVLKPIDGLGSKNTLIYPSANDLLKALENHNTGILELDSIENPHLEVFEVEEYVSGPIKHFDALVVEGNVQIIVGSIYINTCLDYVNGCPLGSIQIPLSPEENKFVRQTVEAVGIKNGAVHLEGIESPNGLTFLEIANRVGGGDILTTFELATGINLHHAELQILLKKELHFPKVAPTDKKFGMFLFPGHHYQQADFCRVIGAEHFRNHSFVVKWNQLSVEDKLTKRITYIAKNLPVSGIVSANTSEDLQHFVRELFDGIIIEPVA